MAIYQLDINISDNTAQAQEINSAEAQKTLATNKPDNPASETAKTDFNLPTAKGVVTGAIGVAAVGANIYKNYVSVNSGDQNKVNKVNFAVNWANKAATIGVTFAFNPGLGFAALGATAVTEAIGYVNKSIAFNRKVLEEDIAIGTAKERIGMSYNRSGRNQYA